MYRLTIQGVTVEVDSAAEAATLLNLTGKKEPPARLPAPIEVPVPKNYVKHERTQDGYLKPVPDAMAHCPVAWVMLQGLVNRRKMTVGQMARLVGTTRTGGAARSLRKLGASYGIKPEDLYVMGGAKAKRTYFVRQGALDLHKLITGS